MANKTAVERLHIARQPKIYSPIPPSFPSSKYANSIVVSTPLEVDSILRRVPYRRLVTLDEVRAYLARKHGTEIACPLTTTVFINLAAAAAEEMRAQGETDITPYWRTLKPGGKLNEQYPGGDEAHKAKLEAEGIRVVAVRNGYRVPDFREVLFSL